MSMFAVDTAAATGLTSACVMKDMVVHLVQQPFPLFIATASCPPIQVFATAKELALPQTLVVAWQDGLVSIAQYLHVLESRPHHLLFALLMVHVPVSTIAFANLEEQEATASTTCATELVVSIHLCVPHMVHALPLTSAPALRAIPDRIAPSNHALVMPKLMH